MFRLANRSCLIKQLSHAALLAAARRAWAELQASAHGGLGALNYHTVHTLRAVGTHNGHHCTTWTPSPMRQPTLKRDNALEHDGARRAGVRQALLETATVTVITT